MAYYEGASEENSTNNYEMEFTVAKEERKDQKYVVGRNIQGHKMFGNIRLENST